MSNLSPPPLRNKLPVSKDTGGNLWADFPLEWKKYFSSIQALLSPVASAGLILWNSVSKVGSNITDIETRNHDDLQNLNTAAHTHLSAINAGLLTGGTDTTLHYHAADRARANHTGTQDTTTITVASIGGVTTLQNSRNDAGSAGYVDGFLITDTGGGNISVAAGECTLRSSASRLAQIYHVTIAAPTALIIPLGTVRWVVVDYNAGNPVVQLDTVSPTQFYTKCYIAEIHNPDGTLHIHYDPRATGDFSNRTMAWVDGLIGVRVVSGEAVSAVPTTRTIAVTAGVNWDGHMNEQTTTAFDSSTGGTFTLEYRNGTGGWTEVLSQTVWPNTQYDNGTGTLATLGNNKYGVMWVVREQQNGIYMLYGESEYANQPDAEAAAPPTTRPEYLTYHGFFIAKIVFQKSATTVALIQDYRPLIGGSSTGNAVANHENLSGLLGGGANDHYHLTVNEANFVKSDLWAFAAAQG